MSTLWPKVFVAIRTGHLKDSTLIAKNAGIACWAPFASPDYLKSAAPLDSPQALLDHCCLQFTPVGKDAWTLSDSKGSVTIPMSGQVLVNDVRVIRSMALAGEGVALLPVYLCRPECRRPTGASPAGMAGKSRSAQHCLSTPAFRAAQVKGVRRSRHPGIAKMAGRGMMVPRCTLDI